MLAADCKAATLQAKSIADQAQAPVNSERTVNQQAFHRPTMAVSTLGIFGLVWLLTLAGGLVVLGGLGALTHVRSSPMVRQEQQGGASKCYTGVCLLGACLL